MAGFLLEDLVRKAAWCKGTLTSTTAFSLTPTYRWPKLYCFAIHVSKD